jgi:hypothetical protein
VPNRSKARNGEYSKPGTDAAALVFWVEVFGVRKGDQQAIEIFGPHGNRMLNSESTVLGNKAIWFGYAGKPRPPQGWLKGIYRAEYRLKTKGATDLTTTSHFEMP